MRGLGRLDYAWPIVELDGKAAGLTVSVSLSRCIDPARRIQCAEDRVCEGGGEVLCGVRAGGGTRRWSL